MTTATLRTVADERLYVEQGGAGPAVVLIHGVGGGNSGHQWRLNAEALTARNTVYVLDLPGFGRSPAQAKPYTAELYTRVLTEFLRDLRQTSPDGVTVVASSLPAAYVVNIAAQEPNLVDRLLLVSPTGLDRLADPPNENFYNTLTRTPLGGLVAGVLRGRTAIDFFLTRQVYLDPSLVTPEVTEPYIQNLRGPDKEHPVFSFISGKLNASVRDSWPRVRQPTRIVWGSDDVNTPVEGAAAFRALRPEVRVDVLRGRAIPNDEDAQNFNRILLDFLQTSSTTTSAP